MAIHTIYDEAKGHSSRTDDTVYYLVKKCRPKPSFEQHDEGTVSHVSVRTGSYP